MSKYKSQYHTFKVPVFQLPEPCFSNWEMYVGWLPDKTPTAYCVNATSRDIMKFWVENFMFEFPKR